MTALSELERLKAAYEELQLRVTRFSSVEQELINTRDQLDHELEMYKRLHLFNNDALKELSGHDFLRLIAEAIIDVFEVESSVVYLERSQEQGGSLLYSEGLVHQLNQEEEMIQSMKALATKPATLRQVVLEKLVLQSVPFLAPYSDGLFIQIADPEQTFSIFLIGLISIKKAPLYSKKHTSHATIFKIFAQQVQSLLSNRQKRKRIIQQITQIQSSDRELKKLSLIATRTKNGVVITDNKGQVEWVNESFEQTSGYRLEEIKGKKPKDFLLQNSNDPEVLRELSAALLAKRNVVVTLMNYTKKGTPYYNLLEITPVFDEDGNLINFISLQKDITQEIISQKEMLQINSRFEIITTKSNIGIWEFIPSTGQLVWNEVMLKQYGVEQPKKDSEMYDFWINSMHPDDREKIENEVKNLMNSQQEMIEQEFRILRKNNKQTRTLHCLVIAERDEHQELIRLVGTSVDVTDAKNTELKLKASEEKYRSIIDNMNLGLAEVDTMGQIRFMNRKFVSLTEDTDASAILLASNAELELSTRQQQGKVQSYRKVDESVYEIDLIRNDGRLMHVLVSTEAVLGQQQETTGFISIYLDITDLKNVQRDVLHKNEELQKINAELDNFVYSISHDLRSPLLSIKGILGIVQDAEDISEKSRNFLQMANSSADRLDETIQEILDYSRNSRLELKITRFNLKERIANIFEDLRYATPANMYFEVSSEGSPMIESDSYRLNTVLKNIISNAVKYYRNGTNAPSVVVHIRHHGETIEITVKDNGQGIAENNLPKIFDMFYRATSNVPGTGLGLYICKEIVSKLSGEIGVSSKLGEGTEMTIKLPAKPKT